MKRFSCYKVVFLIGTLAYSYTTSYAQSKAELYVFFDTECPICQTYTKKIQDLYTRFRRQVSFKIVYPTKGTTKKQVQVFAKEYSFKIPFLIDSSLSFTQRYAATTMPEVVLIERNETIYQGAVDNQFVGLGKFRSNTTEFYLKDALTAITQNQAITIKKTQAVGCLINR